jgi:hypothetical protein
MPDVTSRLINQDALQQDAHVWIMNPDEETFYLVYQGLGNSQTQFVKCTGHHPIKTSTSEVVQATRQGIYTIPEDRIWVYPELDEVIRDGQWGIKSRIKQRLVRGIKVLKPKAYEKDEVDALYPVDQTGSVDCYAVDKRQVSLGQATDIKAHHKKYKALTNPALNKAYNPTKKNHVVLYGLSRGGSAIFSACAVHHSEYTDVKLCILEAPPATISSAVKFKLGASLGKFLYQNMGKLILGAQHETTRAHQAIASIDTFPKHVPLVVISSKQDELVPHKSSLNLALGVAARRQQAIEVGETNVASVYVIQLDNSKHNRYTEGAERARYQHAVHAIYRKHGLPYIEAYANAGESELQVAELTQGILSSQVRMQHAFKTTQDDEPLLKQKKRQMIRDNAPRDFRETVITRSSELSHVHLKRAVSLCHAMPLYKKPLEHHRFFSAYGLNDASQQLDVAARACAP